MSAFPEPKPAQILRYAYLWRDEAEAGAEEGAKDRPAVVVLVSQRHGDQLRVIVAPITHSPPADPRDGLEIPSATCARVGLDSERQWIIAAEVNAFVWPGPDLRPKAGKGAESVLLGYLPPNTFARLRDRIVALGRERRFRVVERSGEKE
ncbi:MAG: hypothetical protein ABUS57_11640 [Pseudomonadota bacterium]